MLRAGGKNLRLNFAACAGLNSDANCFEPAASFADFIPNFTQLILGLIGFDGGRIRRKSSASRANYPALWANISRWI